MMSLRFVSPTENPAVNSMIFPARHLHVDKGDHLPYELWDGF